MRFLGDLPGRTLIWFALALVASGAFAKIADEVHEREWEGLDTSVELAVHKLDSPVGDVVMRTATTIGSVTVVLPMILLTIAWALRRSERRLAIVLAIDSVVASGGNAFLKVVFSRARPTLFNKITAPESYSFPSGHAMNAVAIYGVIAAVFATMYPRARGPIIVLAVPLILVIGLSRVYLGVHWPSDVVGAFCAGIPLLVVSVYLLRPRGPDGARSPSVKRHPPSRP